MTVWEDNYNICSKSSVLYLVFCLYYTIYRVDSFEMNLTYFGTG
jgi:hypothetical protein